MLRRHPSRTSPEGGWGPSSACRSSKCPFYLRLRNNLHIANSTRLASYPVSHRTMESQKENSVVWCFAIHKALLCIFCSHTCDESLKRKQNPCGHKMAPSSAVRLKKEAENSCSVTSLPFPHAVDLGLFSSHHTVCLRQVNCNRNRRNHANNFTNNHDFSF